jgi:hypothetical protein
MAGLRKAEPPEKQHEKQHKYARSMSIGKVWPKHTARRANYTTADCGSSIHVGCDAVTKGRYMILMQIDRSVETE